MTFLEAAVEVLKREGKPLPVKKLAELAVRLNLLSVVGRDPEGTMQLRLSDALGESGHRGDLLEVKPGLYGLRIYPARPYPVESEAPAAPAAPAAQNGESARENGAEAEPARKGRRRRGRRGRGKGAAPSAAASPETQAAESESESAGDEEPTGEAMAAEGAAAEESGAEEGAAVESGAPKEAGAGEEAKEERRGRRRSRRGGRGRRRGEAAGESASEPARAESAVESEPEAAAPVERAEAEGEPAELIAPPVEKELLLEPSESESAAPAAESEAPALEQELLEGEEEFDLPAGPLLAPSHGAEEITRSEEEREVRAEIHGRRSEERGRRHRRERGRPRERERGAEGRERGAEGRERAGEPGRERAAAPQAAAPREAAPQAPSREAAPQAGARPRGLVDAAIDLLRSGEGQRPMHVRHLTDLALKRHLVDGKGGAGEVSLKLRAALLRDQREREADGLRPRVRAIGGGLYALADRKLDPELLPLERELAERASRLREATRAAARRRIQRLPAPAFEALGRALLDKLGVAGAELVRRGDGVAYFGGQKQLGVATVRLLVAMRPGEGEISRRAVGELRAGLAAKGFDEGLLFAGGRASAEALTELKAGKGVVVHDGASLASLCIHHGLGVRRSFLPVDYLDLEWFGELTEA